MAREGSTQKALGAWRRELNARRARGAYDDREEMLFARTMIGFDRVNALRVMLRPPLLLISERRATR